MSQLVAIDMPANDQFVATLLRIWDRGDAALPLDQRLTMGLKSEIIQEMKVSTVIGESGEQRLAAGQPCEPGDALVMCTSGSTGAAKGVVLTHAAVAASARATSERIGTGHNDHWLACLPLAHIGGLSVITRAVHLGSKLTVHAAFNAHAVQEAARNGVTHTSLVATAMARIDTGLFRSILLGGARPPAEIPANVITTYGLTETGSGVVYDGRPLNGVEVHLDHDGEIWIRGAMLLRGYRDGTTPIDSSGWLHTHDLGHFSDDLLVVDGRQGDLIISGGENVWPEAVESILLRHPDVLDAAVTGVADAEWGQRIVAWIVPSDVERPPTLDSLRAFVKEQHAGFMAPRTVHMCAALPRTAIGKLRRGALLAQHNDA